MACGRSSEPRTVKGADFQLRPGRRLFGPEEATPARRLETGKFWDAFFILNRAKFQVMCVKCETSQTREEKRFWLFLRDAWAEGTFGRPEQPVDWNAKSLVYYCWIPWSRLEYCGETGKGLRHRVMQHCGKIWGGKRVKRQKLHREVARIGGQKAIWIPIISWPDNAEPTKAERELREAEVIYERQCRLNTEGVQGTPWTEQKYVQAILLGRRQRFRPLRKLRGGHGQHSAELTNVRIAREGAAERQRRRAMVGTAVRLARRPLKKLPGYGELRIVKRVRAMSAAELTRLIRTVNVALDGSSRSIALFNIKEIMKGEGKLLMTSLTVKSAGFGIRGVRKQLQRDLSNWAARWGREGTAVMVSVRFTHPAATSILKLLENTEKHARMQREDLT